MVVARIQESGLTFNRDKCGFSQSSIKFLGHVLSASGISSDPDKVAAIMQMRRPTTVSRVRQFLGMANQLSKFVPNTAELTKPLRDLLPKSITGAVGNRRSMHSHKSTRVQCWPHSLPPGHLMFWGRGHILCSWYWYEVLHSWGFVGVVVWVWVWFC